MAGSTIRKVILTLVALASTVANGAPHVVAPLPNAHAHNDYEHTRPLFDALDQGFTSVEADVFPIAGNLLVGHDFITLRPERTLETLYLRPLADRVRQNGGHVYPNSARFFLLIDFKGDAKETYRILQALSSRYSKMLTVVEGGKVRPGAVTVVLTGRRPQLEEADSRPRYVGLDGRLSDLESHAPAHFMPMISDEWPKHFQWNGKGPIPAGERAKLQEIVKKAHASGRVVRFWKTPEDETVWRELRSMGVDLINTDELARLETFLRASETPTVP
jgi:Glycerophosphoryl diester phosphodiesterase family